MKRQVRELVISSRRCDLSAIRIPQLAQEHVGSMDAELTSSRANEHHLNGRVRLHATFPVGSMHKKRPNERHLLFGNFFKARCGNRDHFHALIEQHSDQRYGIVRYLNDLKLEDLRVCALKRRIRQ